MLYILHPEKNTKENPKRASNYYAGIILHPEGSGWPFGLLAEYRNLHGKLGGNERGVAAKAKLLGRRKMEKNRRHKKENLYIISY